MSGDAGARKRIVASSTPYVRSRGGELSLHFDRVLIQSAMDLKQPDALVLDYSRTMMAFLLLQPRPQRIGMIGLGGGSIAKYCHRHLPRADFTAVEIDPRVVAMRKRFHVPPDGPRFRVVQADGVAWVRGDPGTLDVLMVDGFEPGGQVPALCTAEFYADCRAKLRDGGLLVVNYWAEDPATRTYARRLRTAFDGQAVFVRAAEGVNRIGFACAGGGFPPAERTLRTRARALAQDWEPGLRPAVEELLAALVAKGRSKG